MSQIIPALCQHLSPDGPIVWLLAVAFLIDRLIRIVALLLALFSDKATARLVKLIRAKKK